MDGFTRLDPLQEMLRLQQDMEQILGSGQFSVAYPPVSVNARGDGITVEAICPGVERSSLEVTVVGDTVTIHGERKADKHLPGDARFHRKERPTGTFTRSICVDERLDPDRARATYNHGILSVQLERSPEAAPKRIEIQS